MADSILDTLSIAVTADTRAASRDIAQLRQGLDQLGQVAMRGGGDLSVLGQTALSTGDLLSVGMESAGQRMENALLRFVRTGHFGFGSLKQFALSVLGDIAAAALKTNLDAIFGKGGGWGPIVNLAGSFLGLSGRASGGPVTRNQPYWVGEHGPELFVPDSAGRIEPTRGGARSVAITINVTGSTASDPAAMKRSAAQVAQAVRRTLERSR
jgi:hypothetical protein